MPRTERFKRENVLLLGIIPNIFKEPPHNTFSQPLVDELNYAYSQDFDLLSYSSPSAVVTYRVALLLVGCDVTACRKLCGLLSLYICWKT